MNAATRDTALIGEQAARIDARVAQLARLLDAMPADAGSTLTLGDCGLPITFAWIDALGTLPGFGIQWPQPVRAYRQRVERLAPVRAELDAYLPALRGWIDGGGR